MKERKKLFYNLLSRVSIIIFIMNLFIGTTTSLTIRGQALNDVFDETIVSFNNTFNTYDDDKTVDISTSFSDDYFLKASHTYNPDIAEISSILSAAAYNYMEDFLNSQKYIEDALVSIGFPSENIESYNYDKEYNYISNRVGYTFSYKTVHMDDEIYNLIFAVIRGTTAGEWYSNFAVSGLIYYDNDVHFGFRVAEANLNKDFKDFMQKHGLDEEKDRNKLLITGHSRGGAVANLFAARCTKSLNYANEENIYAYTFGTPNVSKDVEEYENIFNIVFNSDFVPHLPLESWGFKKNGITLKFFSPKDPEFKDEDEELYSLMEKKYALITGKDFHDLSNFSDFKNAMDTFENLAPTAKDYYLSKKERIPYITLYEYTLLMSYSMTSEKDWITKATWVLSTTKDISDYKPLTDFFVKDLSPNTDLSYAHGPESYIAWVRAYNDLNFKLKDNLDK